MLKARGIGVIFEREGINTLDDPSDDLISLYHGFAQAESEHITRNLICRFTMIRAAH